VGLAPLCLAWLHSSGPVSPCSIWYYCLLPMPLWMVSSPSPVVAIKVKWPALFVKGLIGIVVAALIFARPLIGVSWVMYLIAAWAIITGVLEATAGVRLCTLLERNWVMVLDGIWSLVFGMVVMAKPRMDELTVFWLIGTYAILFGGLLLLLAVRLAKVNRSFQGREAV